MVVVHWNELNIEIGSFYTIVTIDFTFLSEVLTTMCVNCIGLQFVWMRLTRMRSVNCMVDTHMDT